MKNKLISLAILLILFVCVFSCKKKSGAIPVSAEVSKYFDYKKGTYWIYRDALTGKTDSVAVTSRTEDQYDYGNGEFKSLLLSM